MKIALALAIISLNTSSLAQSAGKAAVFTAAQLHQELTALDSQASAKGSSGAILGDYGSHAIKLSDRTASGGAEIHAHFDDIMMVMKGNATLITGGEVVNPQRATDGETTGTAIHNGTVQQIAAGDVVHIPAGTPHQLVIPPGTTYQALVIKLKEVDHETTGAGR